MKVTDQRYLGIAKDWTEKPKDNPPEAETIVIVCGTDWSGRWVSTAMRRDYKSGSRPDQLKRKWRWCNPDGSVFEDQNIEAWRPFE